MCGVGEWRNSEVVSNLELPIKYDLRFCLFVCWNGNVKAFFIMKKVKKSKVFISSECLPC